MGITIKQRERRKGYLGASDVPVVLGFGRPDESGEQYKSQRALWLEKTQEFMREGTVGLAADLGLGLENTILGIAADEHGVEIRRNVFRVRKGTPIAAHLDAQRKDNKQHAYEAKYTVLRDRYGEPGSDQVPDEVAVQCLAQMAAAPEVNTVWVPVLFGGSWPKFEMYRIDRDDIVIDKIIKTSCQWWETHVVGMVEPTDGGARDADVYKRLERIPATMGRVPVAEFERYSKLKACESLIKKKLKAALGDILSHVGQAEGAFVGDSDDQYPKIFTFKGQRGADIIDRKKLQADYPEVYAEVTSENRYGVARMSKNPNHQGDK